MQPNPRFTHPASIATAALVAFALLVAIALTLPTVAGADVFGSGGLARAASSRPATNARISACASAFVVDNRKIAFSGRMQAYTGAAGGKMEMRFDVLRRFNEARHFCVLHADGLGEWLANSEPTATIYVRNVALSQIETAAHYKARVRYRWVDADGKIVAKKLRTTGVCKQKAPLPNPQLLNAIQYPNPGQQTTSYVVRVFNNSASEVVNLPVSLAIDGQPATTQTVDSIEGRATVDVTFDNASVCTTEIFAAADPFNVIREKSDTDNTWRGC